MDLGAVRTFYDYHRWANGVLWDVTARLGEEVAAREIGTQFTAPTLKGVWAHLYGAEQIWLDRWRGLPTGRLANAGDFASLTELRDKWDILEKEQQQFLEGLGPEDVTRVVQYKDTRGTPYALPLGGLIRHVANHGTHHRSEIATMLTMVSGSPPLTDFVYYLLIKSGQKEPY